MKKNDGQEVLSLRIDSGLKRDMEELARRQGISQAALVRLAIGKYIIDNRREQ